MAVNNFARRRLETAGGLLHERLQEGLHRDFRELSREKL